MTALEQTIGRARLGAGRLEGVTAATLAGGAALATALGAATLMRLWRLDALGFNSDEAVYAGQGAAIAGTADLEPFFPIFRAHPLLFQTLASVGYHLGNGELVGRLLSVGFGLATIFVVYRIGLLLYGRHAGLLAAVFLALMPYHVVVTRQVLLDGPMVFFATLTLYLIAKYATTRGRVWLWAAGASMGLTVLGKETSILVVGAVYAFFALSPELGVRIRDLALALALMVVTILPFPLALRLAGEASERGHQYLAYQLFRRPNHEWTFYPATVPPAIGVLVIAAALAGLWLLRSESSWRETLLLSWIAVPALFFQLYPVKGFQYLLPIAPAVALLAGRTLARWSPSRDVRALRRVVVPRNWIAPALAAAVAVSLAVPTWSKVQPAPTGNFLAGSGGLPGGREVGHWIDANVPRGAEMLAIGPSMANVIQFYGKRRAYGLSVGPNPLKRNPVYEAIPNPDLAIRTNQLQYLVWDAFTAARTAFFSEKLLGYVRRYNGRAIHSHTVTVRGPGGDLVEKPVIVVYAVRR